MPRAYVSLSLAATGIGFVQEEAEEAIRRWQGAVGVVSWLIVAHQLCFSVAFCFVLLHPSFVSLDLGTVVGIDSGSRSFAD